MPSRPRLLVICPCLPYPLANGGDIRLFHVLRGLAADFEVHVLGPEHSQREALQVQSGVAAVYSPDRIVDDSLKRRLITSANLWRDMPHRMTFDVDPGFKTTLRRLQSTTKFDAVLIEHLYMMQYAPFVEGVPIFYTAHNVESVKISRWYGDELCSWRRRILRAAQAAFVRRIESSVGKTARAVFATSDVDKQLLERMNRGGRFVVAPNGVDLKYFKPKPPEISTEPPVVLFVGSMFYKPNFEAATFLAREVFPLVRQRVPTAECRIVGNTGTEDCSALHDPKMGVHMVGYVEDVRPQFENSSLLVAPLFIGSGTRIKIIEAMAAGVPVVSTAIGAEGLACTNGKDILIANSAVEMANAVAALLEDRERLAEIGRAGRELVERSYSWDSTVEVMRVEIQRALSQRRS